MENMRILEVILMSGGDKPGIAKVKIMNARMIGTH